jgi:large subunit ribosomal protein L15
MRLPKFGFNNKWRIEPRVVNLRALGGFEAGAEVNAAALAGAGLIPRGGGPVTLLADGAIDRALVILVDRASRAAREKVEAAGGQLVLPARRARTGRLQRRGEVPK